jgi:hypothetical protein
MSDNDNDPRCDKCGKRADFGTENIAKGLKFTNYCHSCFAEDHPEAVRVKDEAFEIAKEHGLTLEDDAGYSKETFH